MTQADEERGGPFAALVARAAYDPEAARGLAAAYASLPEAMRSDLVDAVLVDAGVEGVPAGSALVPLLSAESDPAIAQRIADAIHAAGGAGLATKNTASAWAAGDANHGGAVLVRPLYADFVETWALSWQGERIEQSVFQPMLRSEDAEKQARDLKLAASFEPIPLSDISQLVASKLQTHSGASWPEGSERFRDLLGF